MPRAAIGTTVAIAIIVGWLLRVLHERLPGWDAVAVLVALIFVNVLTEVLDRVVSRAKRATGSLATAPYSPGGEGR